MRAQYDLNTALKVWELVKENTKVFIAYILDGNTAEICIESNTEAKTKTLRVFVKQDAAEKYANGYSSKSNIRVGYITFGNLCSRLSEVYSQEDPSIAVSCLLTSMDGEGTLHDIDTLWTLNSH